MRYILTTDYEVVKVRNKMINMWNEENNNDQTWYIYLRPQYHFNFKYIHKSNVLLEARNIKDLIRQIEENKEIRNKYIEKITNNIYKRK